MKIGFSFGRCVRDIVKGKVDIDDVVVIVSGTMVDRERIANIMQEYMYREDYLYGLDEDTCIKVAHELWDSGKIHQPREFSQRRTKVMENCVWADLFPAGSTEEDPMVEQAWKEYRALLGLSGNRPDIDNETGKSNWGSHQ